ncbi:fructosamine kinase family protein [Demequina sp. NBRC 110054]|uniref:fructosamine kinase family protein n=1 Tax=Demequina sp. NBRC 110054 TaxID=1570343 RepID=UPI0009FD205F|nr:fructosamine kinase family protein [Demequina sp. NBRC 110054]
MSTVVKERADAPHGFFEAEAAGLRWLAEADGPRCAEVIGVSPGRIEVARIHEMVPTVSAAHNFGAALARMHLAGAASFGSPPTGWDGPLFIGERRMPTLTSESWGEFYAHRRVLPFVDDAVAAGNLTVAEADVVRRACDLIAARGFDDDAPPARLHGDLWAGNLLFGADGAVLIDPAAHGGHGETDLAMLALFGAPHLGAVLNGYASTSPLREGWRARIGLHQLHPLAVHAVGHGRAYGVALASAARGVLDAG